MPCSRTSSPTPPPTGFLAKQGVATQVAATLLATAGDNPGRTRPDASFAALCGASPVDAKAEPRTLTPDQRRRRRRLDALTLTLLRSHIEMLSRERAGFGAGYHDSGLWKALSERIRHSDVAFTMRDYVQTDLEVHRQVAAGLAELILGGVVPVAEFPAVRGNGPDAAVN
jgi:hypothetical protein